MVGRTTDRNYYLQVVDHFRDLPNARDQGEVPKDQAMALIRGCDVLVVPSRDEVTPMVILEAMAAGKPVIASRTCGIPEMIVDGETGLLFETGNAPQLASLLGQLGRDPDLRRELGANARQRQRQFWTLAQSRQRLNAVLASLLGRMRG
jgi:glycosyltransferase involved in cell wall biosynthesis